MICGEVLQLRANDKPIGSKRGARWAVASFIQYPEASIKHLLEQIELYLRYLSNKFSI